MFQIALKSIQNVRFCNFSKIWKQSQHVRKDCFLLNSVLLLFLPNIQRSAIFHLHLITMAVGEESLKDWMGEHALVLVQDMPKQTMKFAKKWFGSMWSKKNYMMKLRKVLPNWFQIGSNFASWTFGWKNQFCQPPINIRKASNFVSTLKALYFCLKLGRFDMLKQAAFIYILDQLQLLSKYPIQTSKYKSYIFAYSAEWQEMKELHLRLLFCTPWLKQANWKSGNST